MTVTMQRFKKSTEDALFIAFIQLLPLVPRECRFREEITIFEAETEAAFFAPIRDGPVSIAEVKTFFAPQ